jgi:hypothetical protein
MKGINVKKIAAFAGAAVLFGAAVAFADVTYGTTQLVDQNGQPTVKIYVGSKAMVSDSVAAANIAAKIANEAYKSSTLTASLSGTPTCTVGSGVSGAGTCSVVESSKKVTLEVTVPGTVAGTHTFKTLITDTIDRTLQNRNVTRSEDNYSAALNSADTSGTITSPLRAIETDTAKGKHLYRIGSGQFTGFADYSMVDDQATSTTYTEEQSFWVGSQVNAVAYDSSSAIRDVDVNKYAAMAYSAKFTGNDFGIPVCTGDLSSNDTTNWASCSSDSNSRTAKHRVMLKFLGGDWIISEMTNPSTLLPSATNVTNGGQIKLAKEAKYGIINVGGELDAGTFKIRLSDISVAVGSGNVHPAIIDVLDANDAVIGQIQVDPGTTYTFTQAGTGNSVKVHVYKTAPGFTLNAKWAEMAIYTDEITLKDGSRYNLVSSTDTDKNFKVSLLWKNKDYTGAAADSNVTDSLREIVVYNIDGFDEKTKAGDVVNFLKAKPTFKLTYQGVDLTDDDYTPITYNALSSDSYRIATATGDTQCAGSSSSDYAYTAKLVEIKTNGQQLISGTDDGLTGDYLFDKVLVDPLGLRGSANSYNITATANSTGNTLPAGRFSESSAITIASTNITGTVTVTPLTATTYKLNTTNETTQVGWFILNGAYLANTTLNGTQNQSVWATSQIPTVFYKISGRDCYNYDTLTYANTLSETIGNSVKFDKAGDNTAAQGSFFFTQQATTSGPVATGFNAAIVLKEDAGYYGTTSNNAVYTAVPMITNTTTYQTIRFRTSDSATQQVYYRGLGATTYTNYEPTLVTERGSKVLSVGTSDASIKVANKIGQPTFQFAYADTTIASSANEYILGVGDSKVFGGVTVKVKAIDANCGSCTVTGAGGTPACTVDSTGVSAVINPANAASVEVSQPYKLTSKLVKLDSEGAGAGVAIIVGGPMVNTMAADALQGSSVDLKTQGVVVKEMGNKILVAGYTADETMAAAEQFIAGIKRQ